MPRGGRGSHSTSVPVPLTQSALDARKSFYCDLCGKGYNRMNEYEAHESSYDHQHKKRFMEMKQMQRGGASLEARRQREKRAEEKAGLVTIKPITDSESSPAANTGSTRRGFKSAFGAPVLNSPKVFTSVEAQPIPTPPSPVEAASLPRLGSDTDLDDDYIRYNPRKPTS